jgi:hypothetical protein
MVMSGELVATDNGYHIAGAVLKLANEIHTE